MSVDFAALRARFPLLRRKTYLNSGSCGALADTVQAAVNAYLEERLLTGANWDLWVAKNEAVRSLVAQLLNAQPEEIAVTASASAAINALASACDFSRARNKVVISDFEFPTNAQIWHAQEPRGARVVHVAPEGDGYIPLEAFARAIDEHTQIVAVTQLCYRNGALLDIAGIARLAHARGARIMVDCYQAVGALQVDVQRLDVDFAVGGMVKYLLGTAGLGFLYARAQLIPSLLPTASGWFAQEDVAAMDITANRPSASARRFEAGTPAVVNCYAAEAGLKIIQEVGAAAIESRVRFLARLCMQGLEEIGWPSITAPQEERHGPLVCVRARQVAALQRQLLAENIVTSCRDDNLRASFHCYNSEEDVDALVRALARHRAHYR
ncbi:MAG TPA: aminotransferase class V-fold PLP-dependent enzyme [Steroidobacteraceae bacterium]